MRNQRKRQRRAPHWALLVMCSAVACNDLTEPLPSIDGPYDYISTGAAARTRRGSILIIDRDRRTARFDGTFDYVSSDGETVSGALTGAFMSTNRIWFRFLTERFEYHEATYVSGSTAIGEIFVQGITYEPTGSTFTLSR
jgi:hypothetical protein